MRMAVFDAEQRRVLRGIAGALAVAVLVLGVGIAVTGPLVPPLPRLEDRLAYALRCDLFVVAWLAAGIAAVARARFLSPGDIGGAGLGAAGSGLAVARAVLQNTLEQVVLAVTGHLALASLLRGREMVLLPLLAVLFCAGRLAFWIGYPHGAGSRAFGFGLTFYPSVLALSGALALIVLRA